LSNSFSDASQAALNSLQSDAAAPVATSVSDTPPQTNQPAADPAQAAVPDPAAPELKGQSYKVKINGEEVDVALDELLKGYSRTGDYTRKSMTLAQERKALEEERKQFDTIRTQAQERETAIAAFLRDANQVKQYYEYLSGQQLTPAQQQALNQSTPDQLLHMQQQMEAQMAQRMAQMQQMTQAEIAKVQEAAQARQAQELASELDKTIKGITGNPEFEILNSVDDIGEILCADAMKLNPKTIQEAQDALLQVAKMRAEKLEAKYQEKLKASAVKQAKLTTQGIEPPGGAGITPQPTKFKLGSKDLTKAATEWLNSQNQK
jgi:hypothetical protein